MCRLHVRVIPEDAGTADRKAIDVLVTGAELVLRDARSVAVIVELDPVPVNAGAILVVELALEVNDDRVADLHGDLRGGNPGGRGHVGGGRVILVDQRVHRHPVDDHVLLVRREIGFEDVGVGVHVGGRDEPRVRGLGGREMNRDDRHARQERGLRRQFDLHICLLSLDLVVQNTGPMPPS